MNVRPALKSQYHAALAMLRETIERCPEDLWTAGEHPRTYWRLAYHALFYTHLYLEPGEEAFRPWDGHRPNVNFTDRLPWPPHEMPEVVEPYTRAQLMEYWRVCDGMVDGAVDSLDLDAQECGFPWYPRTPKLDHQINNIRHIQHHAAQLAETLGAAGVDVEWVGRP